MKISYINILLLAAIAGISSCSKSTDTVPSVAPVSGGPVVPKAPVILVPAPEAKFTINNIGGAGILEYVSLGITNQSENADSYFWDFGDGNTSTEKTPVFSYLLHGQYTVKLTVQNRNGVVSEYSTQPFTVICARILH